MASRVDAGVNATAVSCHPGGVDTDLARWTISPDGDPNKATQLRKDTLWADALATFLTRTVQLGANTQVYLAAGGDGGYQKSGGEYFDNMAPGLLNPVANDQALAKESAKWGGESPSQGWDKEDFLFQKGLSQSEVSEALRRALTGGPVPGPSQGTAPMLLAGPTERSGLGIGMAISLLWRFFTWRRAAIAQRKNALAALEAAAAVVDPERQKLKELMAALVSGSAETREATASLRRSAEQQERLYQRLSQRAEWMGKVEIALGQLLADFHGDRPGAKRSLQTLSLILQNSLSGPKSREVNVKSARFQEILRGESLSVVHETFGRGAAASAAQRLLELAGFAVSNNGEGAVAADPAPRRRVVTGVVSG
eukprot:s900_g8.t3